MSDVSMRLNKSLRDDIVTALLNHKFSVRRNKNDSDFLTLAADIHKSLYTLSEHKLLASMPEGFLLNAYRVHGQMCGQWQQFNLRANYDDAAPEFRVSYKERTFNFIGTDKLAVRFEKLSAEKALIEEETVKARAAAYAAVNSAATIAALLKTWPEIEPFIPAKQRLSLLPVVQTDKLNEIFALPVPKKKKASAISAEHAEEMAARWVV